MTPYYDADGITLYNADFRDVLPFVAGLADAVIADPPYGETSLEWDHWPAGWPALVRGALKPSGSMWCFGSMRMFLGRGAEFLPAWRFAQDVVWEKQNGSGFHDDRFKRVHECATHWYPSDVKWEDVHHAPPKIAGEARPSARIGQRAATVHTRAIGGPSDYRYGDTRLARSVIFARNCHGYADNETQKPEAIVRPLVEYSCPPGGLVFSPFAGSGTDLVVARSMGRRAIGCELREAQCEAAVRRLSQGVLFAGGTP